MGLRVIKLGKITDYSMLTYMYFEKVRPMAELVDFVFMETKQY